jgi:hypothetical protein
MGFCRAHAGGTLVVLAGDDDPNYSRQVQDLIEKSPYGSRIRVIRRFLAAAEVARWLQAADLAISVPKTDQLSTSILEAMACGAIPVLSDLDAYRPLHACPAIDRISDCTAAGFARMFTATAAITPSELDRRQQMCARFVRAHFSEASILHEVRGLFTLPPEREVPMEEAA